MAATPTDHAGASTGQLSIEVRADEVFDALTAPPGLAGRWVPFSGSGSTGRELRGHFGFDRPLVIVVAEATRPLSVACLVTACEFLPDRVGTTPTFTPADTGAGRCELQFRHVGLHPQLERFGRCSPGGDHRLNGLRNGVETGHGWLFREDDGRSSRPSDEAPRPWRCARGADRL